MGARLGGGYGRLSDRAIQILLVALMIITLVALGLTSRGDVDMPANSPDLMEDTRP